MCGRYYVDDDTAREIERIIRQVNDKIIAERSRDIYPSAKAPIIIGKDAQLAADEYMWGFPHFDKSKKSVIFNARSETVMEKKMFKESMMQRRCIIPATGFYEWNANKDKYFFRSPNNQVLLIAGFYKAYPDQDRFVILTTDANETVKDIHNRMPLILEPKEVNQWVFEDAAVEFMLHKKPKPLDRQIQGQMSLFD